MQRKKTISQPTTVAPTSWDATSATIMSSMQYLLPHDGSSKDAHMDLSATHVIRYLADRLSFSDNQVMLITAICYYNTVHSSPCDMGDIAGIMGLHPLAALGLKSELDDLQNRGYLYYVNELNEGWYLENKALSALQDNHPFDIAVLSYTANMDFLSDVYRTIKNGMCHDVRNTIVPAIRRMMLRNPHLPVVESLNALQCSTTDLWAMIIFLSVLGAGGEECIVLRDLEQILSRVDAQRIMRALTKGTHPFVQQGLIEPYGADGMAHTDRWVMSQQGWSTMLRCEEDVRELMACDDTINTLTSYTSLASKELFFSPKTQDQVQRLYHLLDDEQYTRICRALRDKSMPTGFCCLFYGTPGTGKTECVQQLAIATGRDIMQVNISTLRDKYVGESEKRLQSIFDTYRTLVRKRSKAPILFFNEADAIFGQRMENTQRSTDKMENAMQNIILQEMERLDGILICTTNLTSNLDRAFDRRFLYKVEFERPTHEARQRIWKSLLSDLTDEQAGDLASRYDFSGGQILNISRKQIINSIFAGDNTLDYERINRDCQDEYLSRNNGRKIGF